MSDVVTMTKLLVGSCGFAFFYPVDAVDRIPAGSTSKAFFAAGLVAALDTTLFAELHR